jgi:hypothetical protein
LTVGVEVPDPVSFLERRKAGVEIILIFGGNAIGLIGLGESVNIIFFTEDLGVGSWLSAFFLCGVCELSIRLPEPEDRLNGFFGLERPSFSRPLSSVGNPPSCCFKLLSFILFIPLCVNVHHGGSSSDPLPSVSSQDDSEVEYLNFGLRLSRFFSSRCNGSTNVESLEGRAGEGGVVGSNAADAGHQIYFSYPEDRTYEEQS